MLSRDELIQLINKIIECDYASEQEADADCDRLRDGVLDPNAEEYIFYDDLSAEEIADKILSYKPIILGNG